MWSLDLHYQLEWSGEIYETSGHILQHRNEVFPGMKKTDREAVYLNKF